MGREVIGTNWTELTCLLNSNQGAAEEKHFLLSCYHVSHKKPHEAYQQALNNRMLSLMPIIRCMQFL